MSLTSGNSTCCQTGFTAKDIALTSAQIRDSDVCRFRAKCATIVDLRADRIRVDDLTVRTLMADQIIQAALSAGDFSGSGDLVAFVVPLDNVWTPVPAPTLAWTANNTNGVSGAGNVLVVPVDGWYNISLNIAYTVTGPDPLLLGWIINGADPNYRLFQVTAGGGGEIVNNASHAFYLVAGSTIQLGVNTTTNDTLTIADANATIVINGV